MPAALSHILGHRRAPPMLAALGSLLLSLIAFVRTPQINNDGVWYLQAAEAFAAGGFRAAQDFHPWPFYSGLIALVAGALRLSYENAAHLLAAALVALASAAFVRLVAELGASHRAQLLAVAIILSHPSVNRFRPLLIRDFGMCAFTLFAVTQLLRFGHVPRTKPAMLWAACSAAALCFRAESIVVAAAAPLCLLADPDLGGERRLASVVRFLAIPLLLVVAFALWLWTDVAASSSVRLGLLNLLQPLTAGFRAGVHGLAASFPLEYGREYAPYILLFGLLAVPVVKIVKVTGLVHWLLIALAWRRKAGVTPTAFARRALVILTAASIVAVCGFLLRYLFMETRYALLTSLLLCVWAPFGLERLWAGETSIAVPVARAVAAAGLGLTLVYGLASTHRPAAHVASAIEWVQHHTPKNARLYTNEVQVGYYGGRAVDWRAVGRASAMGPYDPPAFRESDYAAIAFRGTSGTADLQSVLEQRLRFQRLQSFSNGAGETIVFYRIPAVAAAAPAGTSASP